jgi:hypothetical protein
MKSKKVLLVTLLIVVALLAFFLQSWIERLILEPATNIWLSIVLFYRSFDEFTLWMLLVSGLAMLGLWSLGRRSRKTEPRNLVKEPVSMGPVEDLASWLADTGRGAYFQWAVANRLARLAKKILNQDMSQSLPTASTWLDKAAEQIPTEMREYLEAGLQRAPAPTTRRLLNRLSTQPAYKQDPELVISFLETMMEKRSGR